MSQQQSEHITQEEKVEHKSFLLASAGLLEATRTKDFPALGVLKMLLASRSSGLSFLKIKKTSNPTNTAPAMTPPTMANIRPKLLLDPLILFAEGKTAANAP